MIDVVAFAVGVAIVAGATSRLPILWRMGASAGPPTDAGVSEAARLAYLRTLPLCIVGFWLLLGAAPWAFGWVSGYKYVGMMLGLLAVTAIPLAILSVALFNRPRTLVPPQMRDQPGYIRARQAS